MANVKISALTAAGALDGTELVPVVQTAVTKRSTVSAFLTWIKTQTIAWTAAHTFDVNTSGDAVRISQAGSGNALVVEDAVNPDATPFVIDAAGRVTIGHTVPLLGVAGITAPLQLASVSGSGSSQSWFTFASGASSAPFLSLGHSKNAAIGGHTLASSGDLAGNINWSCSDGTAFIRTAQITSEVDGTPGTNDMPGRLIFSTTSDGGSVPSERMRIISSGETLFGGISTPYAVSGMTANNVQSSSASLTAGYSASHWADTVNPVDIQLMKSRGAAVGTRAIVQVNDSLGNIVFAGDDGTNFIPAAEITVGVDGTPGTNDMPGRIVFRTTADGASATTERARIDSAGNLIVGGGIAYNITGFTANNLQSISAGGSSGIAASFWNASGSPVDIQLMKSRGAAVGTHTIVQSGDSVGNIVFAGSDGTAFIPCADIIAAIDGTPGTNDMPGRIVFRTTADGAATSTERMRIDQAGNVLIGQSTTTTPGSGNATVGASVESDGQIYVSTATANAGTYNVNADASLISMRRSGAEVGSISVTTTATAYNTSSDYRLKNNPTDLTASESGAFIDALRPRAWTWDINGEIGVGFIAHELQSVSPSSVTGQKDAVNPDTGEAIYQAVEYGSAEMIAMMVAELQSLRSRIAVLEGV